MGGDAHELIQLDNVHLVAYPHLFKKLPYDPVKDFEPIAPLFRTYFFVGVGADSKYKTVGDIVADAKAHPDTLAYGSWSNGNPVHLGSALLEAMTGTQMRHVVYKETSMLYTAVANGELNFALGSLVLVAGFGVYALKDSIGWPAAAVVGIVAAGLAALLPNPRRRTPANTSEYRREILRRMRYRGW